MTAPDKIWTAPTDGKCHVGFDTKSMNFTIEYTRTDLVQAAVAAAYEAAARTVDTLGDSAVTEALGTRLCCDGHMCGCQGADVGAYILHHIRALATPDQIAALAAVRAADQAEIELLLKNHNGLTAEIARLTAALATAREDGMREAANRLQDVLDRRVSKKMTRGNDTVANCITIIRSAIQKGAAT